jgi:putative DNA primase/helicase
MLLPLGKSILAIADPENERNLLLSVKNSNGQKPPGLAYRFGQRIVTGGIVMTHVIWDSTPVDVTADQAIASAAEAIKSGDTPKRIIRAKGFLSDVLADGPLATAEVEEMAKQQDINPRTLRRAREALGVESFKDGFQGKWMLRLPSKATKEGS